MSTVLVTGGVGYVGSHACKALAQAGLVPVTYDSLERGHQELVKWGPLEVGDIHDGAALTAAMAKHQPTAVLHFASYIFVDESVAKPEMYARNIVEGTRSLLRAMATANVGAVVVSSSCAVYGIPATTPIIETAPCRPTNPYGAAKLAMEHLLAESEKEHGLAWAALRYFNAAGADPDGETGEWHEPETHLIPRVLDAALGNIPEIVINGVDYPTPDGTCVRDYVHVSDLADAHVRALFHSLTARGGAVFNLGSGNGFSVRDVIEMGQRVTGLRIPFTVGTRRTGDATILVADSARAAQILGWRPKRSDLATQMTDAWNWHQRIRKAGL